MKKIKPKIIPVMPECCGTCPFRPAHEGGWTHVRPLLEKRALNDGSPLCHSTGPRALKRPKGKVIAARICRGARNLQLEAMAALGIIEAATDEAWTKALKDRGWA